jgi:hypothetical protein
MRIGLRARRRSALVLESRGDQDVFEINDHQLQVGSRITEGSFEAVYSVNWIHLHGVQSRLDVLFWLHKVAAGG